MPRDDYVESIWEIFPESDLALERALATGAPTTEGFYPEWNGPDHDGDLLPIDREFIDPRYDD